MGRVKRTAQWCVNPDHYPDSQHRDEPGDHRYNSVEVRPGMLLTFDAAAANGATLEAMLEAEGMEGT